MKKLSCLILLSSLFFVTPLLAQVNNASPITSQDYARAEKFMGYYTAQLIDRGPLRPVWLPDGRFYYRILTDKGYEFILVDPTRGTRQLAFDHGKLAQTLTAASGKKIEPFRLPLATIEQQNETLTLIFSFSNQRWKCDSAATNCAEDKSPASPAQAMNFNLVLSPDKKRGAFIRNYNLWVREIATGQETPLTSDGIKDFGYATDNAGWKKSERAILLWSPDSKKIATYQQDQRGVSEMYLVSTNVGAPRLEQWKYPLPGDAVVTTIQRVIIDVETPKVIRLQMPPDQHRSTQCDDISCDGSFTDVEWASDSNTIAFVSNSRDHKVAQLRVADAKTGAIRDIFEERTNTQFESGQGRVSWRYLPASNEFIWFSEQDNWGHLYLYDLSTGKLKHQITKGEWAVTQLLKVDAQNRKLFFLASGREPGRDPYFSHLYRVDYEGTNLTLLTPEDGNHQISFSPQENYFVDAYSKPDVPATSLLRDLSGKTVVNLERTDITRLTATGWKPPQPFVVKARDGETNLHGLLFLPTKLDAKKKYPIVNYIYPGPQGGSVGSRSFSAGRGDFQALAELGFVVMALDGTCNPLRSKKFHDACYGNMADNTLPDQIAGMKQLAQKYPFIDIERVGIWGHSGGGFAAAAAMFRYPEFYKVGISESGNHDNRNYEDDWGERYIGLLVKDQSGKSNYEDQANQNYAKNLRGHLLLAHGMMDNNVPPSNTLLVVNALIKANKDFDLIVFPNQRHGFGEDSLYMTRRRWDYFIRYLMGVEPPKEFELKSTNDPRTLPVP